jgi:hypothetical protein
MIWHSYRNIIFTVPADRLKPLSNDEQLDVSRDINLVYMHARGVMGDLAWCFLYEKEAGILGQLSHYDISLFSDKIRGKSKFGAFWSEIDGHRTWAADLKERRAPVAYRIPLPVPPTAITPEEEDQYDELARNHMRYAIENDFRGAEKAFQQMHELGGVRQGAGIFEIKEIRYRPGWLRLQKTGNCLRPPIRACGGVPAEPYRQRPPSAEARRHLVCLEPTLSDVRLGADRCHRS